MNHSYNPSSTDSSNYPNGNTQQGNTLMGDPLPIEGDVEPHFVGASDHPSGSTETRRLMGEVGHTAKSKVQEIAQQTSQEVRNRADGYVNSVSGKVRNLEKAVRDAASRTDGEQPQKVTSGAQVVAKKLDGVASYLDRKDSREITEDFGSLVRSNPALVMGSILAAGFLAGRFLRVGDAQRANRTNS